MAPREERTAALRVLGPISIDLDGRPVPVGGAKPRRLLAMLVLHRNTTVSTGQLMRAMWGDDGPDTGVATLHSYVSRLRRLLPPSARLVGQPPGYRLSVDPGAADVDRFETAFAAAFEQLERAPALALACLDEALAEWRGDALAEFSDEWWAQAEATRLDELRLHARETRLLALLAQGLDERAASEAEALTIDHPWRERPWAALLLALHRAGRQGDALRRASEYRSRLGEDLGLEPSAEFISLERDVALHAVRLGAGSVPLGRFDTALLHPGGPGAGRDPSASGPEPAPDPEPGPGTGPGTPPARSGGGNEREVRLIGRDDDLAAVVELCSRRRLVTLLGPGGIGKTQLALRAAAELVDRHGYRSEVVELARVRDEGDVAAAVATQLQVQAQQGRSVVESVLDVLGQRPILMVLDNCEHVLDTVAGFAERLLLACPGARVLATSREPLALPSETVHKVPPLPVGEEAGDLVDPVASPAVALFMERAMAANPDFTASPEATRAVAQLCRRLDGMPLAIELAAARSRSLSPTEMTERLGDRFALLAGASRVSERRHRSLKELVDWSYELLGPDEQELFGRLSTFAGSFDLEAVEQVCGYGQLRRGAVAPVLASLVDKSMVQASTGARTSYRLLETLREYGTALAEVERPELVGRHAAWLAGLCERGAAGLKGPDERLWLDRFDDLFDDLRLAVRRALDAGDLDGSLGLVVPAREHAFRRLRYELIAWAEAALALEGAAAHPLGAAAWGIVAYGRFVRGEVVAAIDLGERSLDLARRYGTDTLGLGERALGNALVFQRDTDRPNTVMRQLVEGAVASGDEARITHAYYMRSLQETSAARSEAGLLYAEQATAAATRCANPTAQAQAAYARGIWLATSRPAEAKAELQRSEDLSREVGNRWFELFARTETLWLRALDREPLEALSGFAEVISAWHRAGDWANQWLSLRHVFGICYLLGADELAVTIYGALERAGAADAFPFEPSAAADQAQMVDDLRLRLGEAGFADAERAGRTASTSEVVDRIVTAIQALTRP